MRWDGADFIVITIGWSDEQIEGWKIMLERNVSFLIIHYFILFCGANGVPNSSAEKRQDPSET
jgi:hypothetical protein